MLPTDRNTLRQKLARQAQNPNANASQTGRRAVLKLKSGRNSNHNKVSKADPISLSFHDSCLRMSDVQLLHGPRWLNDQIFGFYYEYLSHVKYKNNNDMHFVTPEVTQCMKYMDETEINMIFEENKAPQKSFVFFALNDNEKSKSGGAYWSLLVLSRPEKTFFHFDSYGNNNTGPSKEIMNQVKEMFGFRQAKFRPMRCLQQVNGYDCAIHVICMTDLIADYVNRYEVIEGLPLLHMDTVKAKRAELLKLIISLGGMT
ncbi:sentrin-specific protease 8-like [Drosophila sulfurigaster albostrigata]|uniref:sentrin-specific protease 8-like n=1 Tax=Drosophila sulfurigaster albostrigata TaxID=89887 RepID=UPI002D21CC88|nr:sentrin-specific protease 8-like [Drosophila sulfurigaster albostrigata]